MFPLKIFTFSWIRPSSNFGPKSKLWVRPLVITNLNSSKSFLWQLHRYKEYSWSKFQPNLMLFTRVIATKPTTTSATLMKLTTIMYLYALWGVLGGGWEMWEGDNMGPIVQTLGMLSFPKNFNFLTILKILFLYFNTTCGKYLSKIGQYLAE